MKKLTHWGALMHKIYALFVLLILLSSCNPTKPNTNNPPISYNSRIGDKVWLDSNADGIKQKPESGFANIKLNLYEDKNNDGQPDAGIIKSTMTDAGGYYQFRELNSNINYLVEVVAPQGYEFSKKHNGQAKTKDYDSDINPETALSDSISLEENRYFYWIDAALKEKQINNDLLSSVGDKVWLDKNQDGIKQTNEVGLADISINLWQGNNKPEIKIASTQTDNKGYYRFDNLKPDINYFLEIVLGSDYALSEQHNPKASGKDWDSDFNPKTATTGRLDLEQGKYNYWLGDAGLYKDDSPIEPPCDDELCNF